MAECVRVRNITNVMGAPAVWPVRRAARGGQGADRSSGERGPVDGHVGEVAGYRDTKPADGAELAEVLTCKWMRGDGRCGGRRMPLPSRPCEHRPCCRGSSR